MTRSRMASASVGTPIRSGQRSTGTWDDERAFVVAILDDFEQIARLIGRERFGAPIIENQQFDARQGAQEPGVARIPMGDGQIGEEPGHAGVKDGHVLSASLVAESTS